MIAHNNNTKINMDENASISNYFSEMCNGYFSFNHKMYVQTFKGQTL